MVRVRDMNSGGVGEQRSRTALSLSAQLLWTPTHDFLQSSLAAFQTSTTASNKHQDERKFSTVSPGEIIMLT